MNRSNAIYHIIIQREIIVPEYEEVGEGTESPAPIEKAVPSY